MNIKELNKSKSPIVIIDNSLEKYKKLPIFKDKLDKANEILRIAGVPKFKKSKIA